MEEGGVRLEVTDPGAGMVEWSCVVVVPMIRLLLF